MQRPSRKIRRALADVRPDRGALRRLQRAVGVRDYAPLGQTYPLGVKANEDSDCFRKAFAYLKPEAQQGLVRSVGQGLSSRAAHIGEPGEGRISFCFDIKAGHASPSS